MLDGPMVLYLARHEGRAPMRLSASIGDRFPAALTAVGSILLAELNPKVVEATFSDPTAMPAWTEHSVHAVEDLLAKLEATRERGYAIDDGETNAGVYGLAVLLPGQGPSDAPLAVGTSLMKANVTPAGRELVLAELFAARDYLASPHLLRP